MIFNRINNDIDNNINNVSNTNNNMKHITHPRGQLVVSLSLIFPFEIYTHSQCLGFKHIPEANLLFIY